LGQGWVQEGRGVELRGLGLAERKKRKESHLGPFHCTGLQR